LGQLDNTIDRVAGTLKIFEYSAMALLCPAAILNVLKISLGARISLVGIALVVIAPAAGLITAGIFSLAAGNRRLFYYSLIILGIYVLAFFLAR